MLGLEDFMTIQALVKRGVYLCDIADHLGGHAEMGGWWGRWGVSPARGRGRRGSLLDPYRPVVDGLLAEGVWNAVVIWRELQARGYAGGVSILRDYLHPKRPLRPGRATVRFETEPGRQVQTDWGVQPTVLAGQPVAVHFAVSTLSYSRRFHFWGTDSEDAEHTYEALVRAFEWFGGVPGEVRVDNQHRPSARGRRPVPSPVPRSGRPLRLPPAGLSPGAGPDQGQGRAQRRLRQAPFLRPLPRLRELGPPQSTRRAVAPGGGRSPGARHRARGRRRALHAEAPTLQPLPPRRYDTAYWEARQVGWDAYVEVRGNRYSVPGALAGRPVRVRITLDGAVAIYDGEQGVAQHMLQPAAQGDPRHGHPRPAAPSRHDRQHQGRQLPPAGEEEGRPARAQTQAHGRARRRGGGSPGVSQRTRRSVNRGHLMSVFSGQHASVLTKEADYESRVEVSAATCHVAKPSALFEKSL